MPASESLAISLEPASVNDCSGWCPPPLGTTPLQRVHRVGSCRSEAMGPNSRRWVGEGRYNPHSRPTRRPGQAAIARSSSIVAYQQSEPRTHIVTTPRHAVIEGSSQPMVTRAPISIECRLVP